MSNGQIRLEVCGLTINWTVAEAKKHPDQPSGDGYVIQRRSDQVLFAVADGTGSGWSAAEATQDCLTELDSPHNQGLEADFQRCHLRLQGGRGAALGLVGVEPETAMMTWAAVGDIHGLLLRGDCRHRVRQAGMLQRPGTIGISFQGIHAQSHPLAAGDLVILSTDGLRRDYVHVTDMSGDASQIAERTLQTFRRPADDSLVLTFDVTPSS
ncbi:MAG: SpoIIE family protein phosphatase [bacterium]